MNARLLSMTAIGAVVASLALAGCNKADQQPTQADTRAATQDVKSGAQTATLQGVGYKDSAASR